MISNRDNYAPKPSNQEILRKAHETLDRQKEDGYRDHEADKGELRSYPRDVHPQLNSYPSRL